MNINVQFVDTRKIASVEELVNEKLTHLEAKYDFITNSAVFLKEEKHEGDRSHVCEVRLSVPGPQLFASSNETFFEKAVARTFEDLQKQLQKYKEKIQRH